MRFRVKFYEVFSERVDQEHDDFAVALGGGCVWWGFVFEGCLGLEETVEGELDGKREQQTSRSCLPKLMHRNHLNFF